MNTTKKKILLVDDNTYMTQILCQVLTEAGYETRAQNDSTRALQTARAFKPDLALLDIDMPGLDGGDVARQFKDHVDLSGMHVIFLTGLALGRDLASRSDSAAEMILPKPISITELTKYIEIELKKSA